ncbi:MAG: hypothetical protein HYU36_02195 [Planctomycetes bacterium]|nr:hypothetical protein [Planctomycetota bacterium]
MKHDHVFFASLVTFVLVAPSREAEENFEDAHRFIFYSVLEGCFEDGLSTEDVSQILLRREKESYFHFIYACPVCLPTIHALEVYRSRPDHFYGVKGGASTFGSGLTPDLKRQLYSGAPADRLVAINSLVQRWTARRMSLLALSDEQRGQLQKAFEEMRKKGMETLKSFKAGGTASYYAPAFATIEECAACNGAVGKGLKVPDPQ